jgi:hypothetical protein
MSTTVLTEKHEIYRLIRLVFDFAGFARLIKAFGEKGLLAFGGGDLFALVLSGDAYEDEPEYFGENTARFIGELEGDGKYSAVDMTYPELWELLEAERLKYLGEHPEKQEEIDGYMAKFKARLNLE